jgi:tripartite-type tricarboxylate transporter receptor subunit TctC
VQSQLPGYIAETWFGVIAAAGTPPEIVSRLNAVLNAALETPEMQQKFRGFGVQVRTTTPQKLGELIAQDVARWAPIIRENNIRSE